VRSTLCPAAEPAHTAQYHPTSGLLVLGWMPTFPERFIPLDRGCYFQSAAARQRIEQAIRMAGYRLRGAATEDVRFMGRRWERVVLLPLAPVLSAAQATS
jgi:hypothetical protein